MAFSYPATATRGDFVRAGLGLSATVTPLATLDLPLPVAALLAGLAAIFALFAWQTAARSRLRLEVDEHGVRDLARGRGIRWSDLEMLALAYFSVRRDGEAGWMELRLEGAGVRLRVDSRLNGFAEIVRPASEAARRRGLDLDPATRANLDTIGADLAYLTESHP